jgi:uncharacterized protein
MLSVASIPERSTFDRPAVLLNLSNMSSVENQSRCLALIIIIIIIAASLHLTDCNHVGKGQRMESAAQQEQMIAALGRAYAAFNRGDIDAALEPFDTQIEWTEPMEFPGGGTYHGRDGAKRYLTQSRAALAEGTSEPEKFMVASNRIVVFVHAHVRPKGSSEWHDVRLADVYTFRDGKAIEMRAFTDRQEALRWAGAKD